MPSFEAPPSRAQRRVWSAAKQLALQAALIREFERRGDEYLAAPARALLDLINERLNQALRDCLKAASDTEPKRADEPPSLTKASAKTERFRPTVRSGHQAGR
jgi:hypothetical protein